MKIRPFDVLALSAAAAGVALALEAQIAGSLLRYRLAGFVAGSACCVPLATLLLLRERARVFWRRCAFALAPVAALLVFAETAVRVLGAEREAPAELRADARLGHVVVPHTAGTDARGFRNAEALERADVVCVGDSQTWGFHVERDETFAAVLGRTCDVASYQMANGNYGPVQYRELVRSALELSPRLVVVGLYFGNDLIDADAYAGLPCAADLRAPGVRCAAPALPATANDAPNATMAAVDWMLDTSRVLGHAADVVKSRLPSSLDAQPGSVQFAHATVPTVLEPWRRLQTVDPARDTVRDGLRITGLCLADIGARCRAAGVRCLLLAIPTKEYAYEAWLCGSGRGRAELAEVHAAEAAMRAEVFRHAEAAGLEVVDFAADAIRELDAGRSPWNDRADGHVNAHGHALAAAAIARVWSDR